MSRQIITVLYVVLFVISAYATVIRVQAGETNAAIVTILIGGFCVWRLYGFLSQRGADDD